MMAIALPRLTRCCFCCSLRTGCLIVGYVSIVLSLLGMAATSMLLYVVVAYVNSSEAQANPEHSPEELAKAALGIYVSQAYYLLVYLYLIVISIMMLVGVHANKPRLLIYYVYSGFFLLVMAIALVVVSFVFAGFITTSINLALSVAYFHCLLVVWSRHREIEDENKPRELEMQNLYSPPAPLRISFN